MSWDWEKLKEQQDQRSKQMPPQVDEFFNKFKGSGFSGLWVIAVVAVVWAALSIFFTVDTNEMAVVQRFGAYSRTMGPGLHVKYPFPVEKKTIVNVTNILTEEFEGQVSSTTSNMLASRDADTSNVSLMLTGDLNVAVVPWIVQYRVADPKKYLFDVEDVLGTLRDLSEASMRQVIGDRSIDEVITRREEIASAAMKLMQKEFDEASTGIQIKTVNLKTTTVPPPVQPSFNEVNQALQEKEKMIYQAREAYNKVIPSAKGDAQKTIKVAEGYAAERVNEAQGDALRFISQYTEYKKAPDVTRRRMYLEAMGEVLPKMGSKYIVDDGQKNMLPLLNLGGQSLEVSGVKK